MTWEPLTWDEALLWLNDRLGKSVHAAVVVEMKDRSITVLYYAEGEPRRRQADPETAPRLGYVRDDLRGWYTVGGASLDLTDLDHVEIRRRDDAVRFALGDGVYLELIEQQPDRSASAR